MTEYASNNNPKKIKPDSVFQGVEILLVLAFNGVNGDANKVDKNSHRKYVLSGVETKNYNTLIDAKNFYDLSMNDSIKKYNKIRKIATGQGDDYTLRCFLDYCYFKNNYQLIPTDLSKQKILEANPIWWSLM